MSQSLAQLLVHIVFSTRERRAWLTDDVREPLHAYIGGIVADLKGTLLRAGSVSDHIHLLCALPRTRAPADVVREVKAGSSRWLRTDSDRYGDFHWQGGYGMFSISPSHRAAITQYIDRQAEHHRVISFEDEFLRLLEKYGLQHDEQHLWD